MKKFSFWHMRMDISWAQPRREQGRAAPGDPVLFKCLHKDLPSEKVKLCQQLP